jgi:putative FmdB family regulatory protein
VEVEMPTYEYRCGECRKRISIYMTYDQYGVDEVRCPQCGSDSLARIITRVRVTRSEGSRLDNLSDAADWGDLDDADPRSMARMMRKMSSELGEEIPSEFNEVVNRLEAGESPEEIEASMPELGSMEDGLGGID